MIDWAVRSLADVCAIVTDGTHASPVRADAGVPVLSAQNVKSDELNLETDRFTTTQELLSFQRRITPSIGDVLLTIVGSIGRSAVLREEADFVLQRSVAILRPRRSVDPSYLKRALDSAGFQRQLASATNSSAQAGVYLGRLSALSIPLPPLPEQRRIASILGALDATRELQKEAVHSLTELASSTYDTLFGGPLDPLIFDELPISDVCEAIVDCVNRTAPLANGQTQFKMIRTSNVRNLRLDVENVRYVDEPTFIAWTSRLKPQRGDVLLTREAPAGEAAAIRTDDQLFLGQRIMHYRPRRTQLLPEYLAHTLAGSRMQRRFNEVASGSTVKHLSVPYCRTFTIPIPPIAVQAAFEDFIADLSTARAAMVRRADLLDELFASLQHRAFTGQL